MSRWKLAFDYLSFRPDRRDIGGVYHRDGQTQIACRAYSTAYLVYSGVKFVGMFLLLLPVFHSFFFSLFHSLPWTKELCSLRFKHCTK